VVRGQREPEWKRAAGNVREPSYIFSGEEDPECNIMQIRHSSWTDVGVIDQW